MRSTLILAVLLVSGCGTVSTTGVYPADATALGSGNAHFYTSGVLRYHKDDLLYAFERAAATNGGLVEERNEGRLAGGATKKSLDRTCADTYTFAGYFEEVDDRPTTRYVIAADHKGFCGAGYAKSLGRSFGSELFSTFNMLLTTLE